MVIGFHYFPSVSFFRIGWSGVDLFFVLSGFLITSRLIPFIEDKHLLLNFYRNRALRILPLYFTFLCCFFCIWFFFVSKSVQNNFTFYDKYWYVFFLFGQNWLYIFNKEIIDHLNHFWSLAVEEQFYLIFPLLIIKLKRQKKILQWLISLVLPIVIVRTSVVIFYDHTFTKIYWNTFLRLDSFLVGAILYFVVKISTEKLIIVRTWFRVIYYFSLTVLVVGFSLMKDLTFNNYFVSSIGYTLIAVTYCYFIFYCVTSPIKKDLKIVKNKHLQFVGKISYGLYVFHWPIYLSGFAVINKLSTHFNIALSSGHSHLINVIYSLVISFLLSYLSYRYLECYFLKFKVKLIKG